MRLIILLAVLLVPISVGSVVFYPDPGVGSRPFTFRFGGSHNSTWPDVDKCLKSTGGGSYQDCGAGIDTNELNSVPHYGHLQFWDLVCSPGRDHEEWSDADSYIEVALFEITGSNSANSTVSYVRSQIGGVIRFDNTDPVGVSKRLSLANLATSIENGSVQVKISDVLQDTSSGATGVGCVLSGWQ